MVLGDLDTFMSIDDYINAAKVHDIKYGEYVENSLCFVQKALDNLNTELLKINRVEYKPEIRIKNSNVLNSEVSSYAFYINSEVLSTCYKICFSKYVNLFINKNMKNLLIQKTLATTFQFIIYHELSHLFRAHHDIKNISVNQIEFIQSTEMDADLIAAAKIYRILQVDLKNLGLNDLDIKAIAFLSVVEVLYAMHLHTTGNEYQSEYQRLWDIFGKIIILNESPDIIPDQNFTSDISKRNGHYILGLLFKYREKFPTDDIAIFINDFLLYVINMDIKNNTTNRIWDTIKNTVACESNTNV